MTKLKLIAALFMSLIVTTAFANNPIKKTEGSEGILFFKGTFKEALAKAKKENKKIFMDCYTTWCGPCKKLKSSVFPDKNLAAYINQNYVSIAVDYENGEGPAISQLYPVEGYPTLYFLDSNGKVKKTFVGLPSGGASELLSFAQKIK
ncbi:Thioredoxin-like [Pseudarcicella hirudinis]|uniref:Thioredoxin-like n=1 Tax=Pseudarcicella hirudinis TaxID=1079859 RepID=A0A1I5Z0I1_9BACT|nr:thioredoxin family protein [Pseudarcicella hirudinis]SFQ50004.1 Thioredoxin-like [Pseudarcicella hirudinis]